MNRYTHPRTLKLRNAKFTGRESVAGDSRSKYKIYQFSYGLFGWFRIWLSYPEVIRNKLLSEIE